MIVQCCIYMYFIDVNDCTVTWPTSTLVTVGHFKTVNGYFRPHLFWYNMALDLKKLLIEKVKEYPQLYDKRHVLYRDPSSAKVWGKIQQELQLAGMFSVNQ